jgi:hypothetical protein
MNIVFMNPWLLLGLTAAVVPVLIHRITQKKAVTREFTAVGLLLQSQRISAKPQRLKHLLLLALRILAVAAIVLMMARPVLVRSGSAHLLERGARVLILDNSLSMGYREEGGLPRYDGAKKAAGEALEGFGGRIALIPTVNTRGGDTYRWMEPEEALEFLEELPLSFGRGDTSTAFASAYKLLGDLKVPRQILILSDMARNDWEGLDLTRIETISEAEVTFLRTGGPGRDPNIRVKEVGLAGGVAAAGVPSRLEVTVANLSDQSSTTLVRLLLSDAKVGQKSIRLDHGQEGKVFFDILVDEPGWIDAEVAVSPDRLPADDTFFFPLRVRDKAKILVVDGDPGTSLEASESYFLAGALRPGGLDGSPFLTRVVTENEMTRMEPSSYDALILLNVARPDPAGLSSFLEMGKPVFLFLGDRIVPEAYNRFPLAPWQIRERIELSGGSETATRIDTNPDSLGSLSWLGDGLKSATFDAWFRIEGTGKELLTLKSLDPLLLEADAGKSRLFMFVSSADLDWNDLPLQSSYLPLVQELIKEAVGLTGASLPAGTTLGEPFREEVRPLQMKGPRGGPGIYQFLLPEGELRRGVNPPPGESDLAKVSEDEMKKKFGTMEAQVVEYREGVLKDLRGGRKALWPLLLGFLLAVLVLEMTVSNGMPRRGSRS